MPYPDYFYHKEKSSESQYSTTPQGTLDVGRLINGRPYWKKLSAATEKPKSLILADWTADKWSEEKIKAVIAQMRQLIADGFTVYIWQGEEVLQLTQKSLDLLNDTNFRRRMIPVSTEQLIKATSAQHPKLTKSNTVIIDDYTLDSLTHQNKTTNIRSLELTNLTTNAQAFYRKRKDPELSRFNINDLCSLLKKMVPPLTKIVQNEFSWAANNLMDLIKEHFPSVQIEVNYQKLVLNSEEIDELIKNNKVTINGITFDWSMLEQVETLDFEGTNITAAQLQKILAHTPKLKSLNLRCCEKLSDFVGVDLENTFNLPNLEQIDINYINFSVDQLQMLLADAPHLKRIEFPSIPIGTLTLPSIEHIHFTGKDNAGIKPLQHLISHSSSLISLNIRNINEELNIEELRKAGDKLSFLDSLTIGSCTNCTQLLQEALTSKKLRKLEIYNGGSFEKLNLTSHPLTSLSEVTLFSTQIHPNALKELLINAPNLNKLTIQFSKGLVDFDFTGVTLIALNYIDLGNTPINDDIIRKLLVLAPNLKVLLLNSDQLLSLNDETRAELERLKISTSAKGGFLLNPTLLAKNYPSPAPKLDEVPAVDPVHDPQSQRDFIPTKEDSTFKFKGTNPSRNQGMIIEKLSQYLTLTDKHTALIPKLQDGICNALTHHFTSLGVKEWGALLDQVQSWNGRSDSPDFSKLTTIFDTLFDAVKKYQLGGLPAEKSYYLGDNLKKMDFEGPPHKFILGNPWHAIAVTYAGEGKGWTVYDPNFIAGPKSAASKEELLLLIKDAIGTLVFIEGKSLTAPLINHPETFLAEGGLLALFQAENKKEMLAQLPSTYLKDALDGLLMRDMRGKPAWIRGIKDPDIAPFTLNLLQQFAEQNPDKYLKQLQESMEAISPHERHEAIVALINLIPTDKPLLTALCMGLRSLTSKDYLTQLETWRKPKDAIESVSAYCQKLVEKTYKKNNEENNKEKREENRLIECDSSSSVQALSLAALKHCKSTSRPVFYVNSPDDLVCSASWVQRTEDGGVMRTGPGGPLYEFLTQNTGKAPVLIINYDRFSADDLVRFNSLLDKERIADGTPVPKDTLILGFINPNKPTSYHGADFYSRFNSKKTCPLSAETLSADVLEAPKLVTSTGAGVEPINLGHAEDWEERLLGRWLIKEDKLVFEEGELVRALATKKPIQIQNGPWNDPRFQLMWQQAMIRGYINHAGRTIKIPEDLVWSQREGYDWKQLASNVSFPKTSASKTPILLNPKTLSTFFSQYECDTSKETLNSIDGLLKQHKNSTMDVHLTRTLSEDEWGLLLSECVKHGVKLACTVAPGVTLPKDLAEKAVIPKPAATILWEKKNTSDPLVITSSDTATTIALLTHEDADWMVIEISECEVSTLLGSLEGGLKQGSLGFAFREKIGVLQKALADNKKVLLHGDFSPEMMDALAPILLNPRDKGRLVLVSEDPEPFNYCSSVQHTVTVAEKESLLTTVNQASDYGLAPLRADPKYETTSYNVLVARLTYQRAFPKTSGSPWQGMDKAPPPVTMGDFDVDHSKKIAEAFVQKRLDDVFEVLLRAPYVYLTGPTAVGKSTFVEKNLKAKPGVTVYSGESRVQEWADDKRDGMKVLFIDEENITARQWREMEGLFNKPPGLLINGAYCLLSENHKVVFAGNPLNYGGERRASPLFASHGNALLFEPLPPEFIYEYILKPVFAGTGMEAQVKDFAIPILDVYRFICQQTKNEALISPRELQMMALMVASYAKQYPKASKEDLLLAAHHYAYRLGRSLNNKDQEANFDARFKPELALPHEALPAQKTDFLVTASRQAISQKIDDVLVLREFRQSAQHDVQKYGGLGGMVLEGEPGIGKSEMVIAGLRARGYTESRDYSGPPNLDGPVNRFYRMPVSWQYSDKVALLLKAFNEGAVVIIDEINSSPMMERLLNSLLMGKTLDGSPPEKPGFLIIGTQNPVSMEGRIATSSALARRLININLPPYTTEEMKIILEKKGIEPADAASMVEVYEKNKIRAQLEQLKPTPTFRDLIDLADRVLSETAQRASLVKAEVIAVTVEATPIITNETPSTVEKRSGEEVQQPVSPTTSDPFTDLEKQIRELREYGYKLITENKPIEGNKTITLANTLDLIAQDYKIKPEQRHQLSVSFTTTLSKGYKDFGISSDNKRLCANILLSIVSIAFGVGLIVKYLLTGSAFFSEGERQTKINEMKKSLKALSPLANNETDPPDLTNPEQEGNATNTDKSTDFKQRHKAQQTSGNADADGNSPGLTLK
jgi:MoxR-like ATPase